MTLIQADLSTIDATWNAVARQLGATWQWSRQQNPGSEPETWCGWLRGPSGLCAWVRLNQSRWEIRESFDTVVPQTGERFYTPHLYGPSEAKPTMEITVSRSRPATAVAKDIERRLLPSLQESLRRVEAYRHERASLFERRQQALDSIRRLCPWLYQFDPGGREAPAISLGPRLQVDLRIDDTDNITITQWRGLRLGTTLRLIATALDALTTADGG